MGCRIVRNSQGKSRGIAFADFKDDHDAEKCQHKLDFIKVEDCPIPIRFFKSRPPENQTDDADYKTAFVKNIPSKITESELNIIFKQFGSIEDIRLIKSSKDPTINKGICYIQFGDTESVTRCI